MNSTATTFEVLQQGFVYRCPGPEDAPVAITSRCVVLDSGELLCSFMTQAALSSNDFVPCLSASTDGGSTWESRGPIWPELRDRFSMNTSISRGEDGTLFLFGGRTPRDLTKANESFWNQSTLGILPNDMIWSRSTDDGQTWSDPEGFPLPLPGAAELPAPLCPLRSGRWVAPYSPHNTFDPDIKVDLRHVVLMISDDQGNRWRHTSALRVEEEDSYLAEAWVTQLDNDQLLATAWHLRLGDGDDYPNVYALSSDHGDTWSPTTDTPIHGQSAGLAPLPDGRVLMAYNQRRHGEPGVRLALAKPTDRDFGLIHDELVWSAARPSQNNSSGKSTEWTDFAFGEPGVTALPNNQALVLYWCIQPDGAGIGYVKVQLD